MINIIPTLIETVNYDECTALHLASSAGHNKVVVWLLQHAADPEAQNRWGRRPCDVAEIHGHEACVDVLNGAVRSPVTKDRRRNQGSEREPGKSTVRSATSSCGSLASMSNCASHPDSITPFMQDPDVTQQFEAGGITATREMCFAASKGLLDEVKRLLNKRADCNAKDYDSRTALHIAVCGDHLPIVEFLFSQTAYLDVRDRWGHTPLEHAVTHKRTSVATWLRKNGAT